MIVLPPQLAPPAPFPLVVNQWSTFETIAPGIRRGDYRMTTNAGPVVVHVIAVDTHDPNVRLGSVVAHDRMISAGETVSSMAARTGAVAGINADYFDIGNTNQPLNVVVRDGVLLRSPSKRAAIGVAADGSIAIGSVAFAGSATYDGARVPLTGVNEFPPQGGAGLLTPAYGTLGASADVTTAALEPLDTSPGLPGTYRVTAIGAAIAGPVRGTLLALGPAARAIAPPPLVGDTVALSFDATPAVSSLLAAVGGGPQLVMGGAPYDDPNSPAPEERNIRFPVAGAATTADGTLLLIVVDGRKPAVSIGLTRPEFGALMRGFGATDGLAFDSGGSATLAGRIPGDAAATVLNDPSDGRERPVADGLFVYSLAPAGVHPHLIVHPAGFTAYAGARIPLRGAIVDDADHRVRAADIAPLAIDPAPGPHVATVRERDGSASATIAYRTVDRVTALTIVPDRPNPAPGTLQPFNAIATDERGAPVMLDDVPVRWTIRAETPAPPSVASRFVYDTARGDATVTATLGNVNARTLVQVGDHAVSVANLTGTVLTYDFTGSSRAAYSNAVIPLPGEPVRLSLEVFGDGNGVPLRASFINRYGEKSLVTLAKSVDWTGWRTVTIALPADLNPPVRITSIYVVRSLGGPPVRASGSLQLGPLGVMLPGRR